MSPPLEELAGIFSGYEALHFARRQKSLQGGRGESLWGGFLFIPQLPQNIMHGLGRQLLAHGVDIHGLQFQSTALEEAGEGGGAHLDHLGQRTFKNKSFYAFHTI